MSHLAGEISSMQVVLSARYRGKPTYTNIPKPPTPSQPLRGRSTRKKLWSPGKRLIYLINLVLKEAKLKAGSIIKKLEGVGPVDDRPSTD